MCVCACVRTQDWKKGWRGKVFLIKGIAIRGVGKDREKKGEGGGLKRHRITRYLFLFTDYREREGGVFIRKRCCPTKKDVHKRSPTKIERKKKMFFLIFGFVVF